MAPATRGVFIHPTAVVDEPCAIGEGSKVWHFAHVCAHARIGTRCTLGQNVYVASSVVIGSGARIQNNVSIYDGVTLEDDVFCGPSMVFTNVRNPRAHISRKHAFLPTLVRRGATLGANCTVLSGLTVGRYAFLGAGTVVTHDVPDFALVVGTPGRVVGWMCACGEKLAFEVSPAGASACGSCGAAYRTLPRANGGAGGIAEAGSSAASK
jgi:UDP-2-acetamido-3-amino-2,3-dideoxy-glucuronate N-acetyltransferase